MSRWMYEPDEVRDREGLDTDHHVVTEDGDYVGEFETQEFAKLACTAVNVMLGPPKPQIMGNMTHLPTDVLDHPEILQQFARMAVDVLREQAKRLGLKEVEEFLPRLALLAEMFVVTEEGTDE